ncbi:hypothetical protein C8Q76DRAFT_791368 [Earliella scabrosa]|nr:hypothetical protein C8Q76DRAFT_791368 [Earliella scabrosa]
MISIITVNLVSGFLEFTLFGIFIILSFASLILLVRRHCTAFAADRNPLSSNSSTPSSVRKSPLVIANVLLMFTVNIHFVFSAQRLVAAVIRHDGGAPTVAFLIDLRERTQVARLVLLVIAMFIGYVVITFLYGLSGSQLLRITVFPILAVIGVIVAGNGMIHQFMASTSDVGVFTAAVRPWIAATSWVILHLTGSPLEAIGSGTAPVMIGITLTLITVRVGTWSRSRRC